MPHVNPNGGAIACARPSVGMSGARLALSASTELQRAAGAMRCVRCIGVGQGIICHDP